MSLPACPLCGKEARRDPHEVAVRCSSSIMSCALGKLWMSEEDWRRLAAPALPPTVTAVLEAAVAWSTVPTDEDHAESVALEDAIYDWGETGRPGLPRAATTKATTMRCPTHGSIVCRCDQEGR